MFQSNTSIVSKRLALMAILALSLTSTACGNKSNPSGISSTGEPLVLDIKSKDGALKAKIDPTQTLGGLTLAPAQTLTLTLNKSELLTGETFGYVSDLQYSSLYDQDMDLYTQSYAVPVTPAYFRILGRELQLVTDNKLNFPSDVNHPEQILVRYPIINETATTLTVQGGNSAITLAQVFGPLPGATGISVLDSWIRSYEYDPKDRIILQQTSIMLPDGTLGEFMESIFPYSNIAAGSDFLAIPMDPENPYGGDGELFERFRFLDTPRVFNGEQKVTFAQHFDISPKADGTPGTIDWWVTRNIPDEMLEPVKLAVEGWNRYFRNFVGVNRDVVRFMGRLPEGIHLGDPRYNAINWDSRLVAGAAYESASSDPMSGKMSHSLIYMPAAWVAIGMEYWDTAQLGEEDTLPAGKKDATRTRNRLAETKKNCARDLRDAAALIASGAARGKTPEEFGVALLKSTLFHEMGHALGLAHNFKGSLVNDGSEGAAFSSSIMDYNFYGFEGGAFNSLDSSDGTVLEYDRQILSVLYNQARDISTSDAVMPVCTDWEADWEQGGVDPLCARYDAYSDPTTTVSKALRLVNEAALTDAVTLTEALRTLPRRLFTNEKIATIDSQDTLLEAATEMLKTYRGTLFFYYISGEHSIGRSVRSQTKVLLKYAKNTLPETHDASAMRERVFQGVQTALSLKDFPAHVKQALDESQQAAWAEVLKSPFMRALPPSQAAKIVLLLHSKVNANIQAFLTDTQQGLPRMRRAVLATLARKENVPYSFSKGADGKTVDYEKAIITLLADAATDTARTPVERVTAVTSLATYAGRTSGKAAIESVYEKLEQEAANAQDDDARELAEALLTATQGG